jgi:hypothetical protein
MTLQTDIIEALENYGATRVEARCGCVTLRSPADPNWFYFVTRKGVVSKGKDRTSAQMLDPTLTIKAGWNL